MAFQIGLARSALLREYERPQCKLAASGVWKGRTMLNRLLPGARSARTAIGLRLLFLRADIGADRQPSVERKPVHEIARSRLPC